MPSEADVHSNKGINFKI